MITFFVMGWQTKSIRLDFLVDFIWDHMNLIKNSFEAFTLSLAVILIWKFTAYIVFYVFIGQKSR